MQKAAKTNQTIWTFVPFTISRVAATVIAHFIIMTNNNK
jgi:hypothetical protein